MRRLLGFLRGPLGCLSFLAGMVVVLAAFMPWFVNRSGAQVLEEAFFESFAGELEVGGIDTHWARRQSAAGLVLRDPDGVEILDARVSGPSLLDLLSGGGTRLGRGELEIVSMSVERDAQGRWNLARALEARQGVEQGVSERSSLSASGGWSWKGLPRRAAKLALGIGALHLLDPHNGGPADGLTLTDFTAELTLLVEGVAEFSGRGRLVSPESSGVRFEGAFRTDSSSDPTMTVGSAAASVDRFSVEWLDGFLRMDGKLQAAVGPVAAVELALVLDRSGPSGPSGSLRVEGDRASASLHLIFVDGQVVLDPARPSSLKARDVVGWIDEFATPYLPAGSSLSADLESLEFVIQDLKWSVPAALGGSGTPGAGLVVVDAALGAWVLETPQQRVRLDGLRLGATMVSDSGLRASLSASVGQQGRGDAVSGAVSVGLKVDLGERPAGLSRPVEVSLALADVETALLDGALGDGRLLRDLLGERLSLTADLEGTDRPGVWSVVTNASSPVAMVDLAGVLEDGRIIGRGEQMLDLRFDLTPLSNPRVIGGLVPMLVSAEKPAGADPARITLTHYELPLDGNADGLVGDLTLELGAIDSAPIRAHMVGGRLIYDPFELEIAGRWVPFTGFVDLVSGESRFEAQLSSDVLGGDFGDFLGEAADAMGGELLLPVDLSGQ